MHAYINTYMHAYVMHACMHAYVIPTHKSDFWLFMRDGWGAVRGWGQTKEVPRLACIYTHTLSLTHTLTHTEKGSGGWGRLDVRSPDPILCVVPFSRPEQPYLNPKP
jgi:hypothetical protein